MLFIFILPHHERDRPKTDISELLVWLRIRAITIISTEIKGFGLRKEGIGERKSRRKAEEERKTASVPSLATLEAAHICSPLAPVAALFLATTVSDQEKSFKCVHGWRKQGSLKQKRGPTISPASRNQPELTACSRLPKVQRIEGLLPRCLWKI